MNNIEVITAALDEAKVALNKLRGDAATLQKISLASQRFSQIFVAEGRIFSCGNGGSMCDAMHFAEELTGRFRRDRKPLSALAISDPSYLTCTMNDFGPDQVYSRFIEAHGRAGDALLAISTSGKSKNVVAAAKTARERGLFVVALTGKPDSALASECDLEICTTGGVYADRVQELHIKVIHILIELIESQVFAK